MAEKLFEVSLGFSDTKIHYLSGLTGPTTTSADQAPKGSFWTDVTSGDSFKKKSAGAGEDKWVIVVDKPYFDTYVNGVSWREPAKLADFSLTTLTDVLADLNDDDQIQGVTVAAGDRLLLGGLIAASEANIYTLSGTTGNWALSEDANGETSGDTVYVEFGDNQGKRYTFNGTVWVLSDKTTVDELAFLRQFIGKDAIGNEMPNFSSVNVVAVDDPLETAISKLDQELGEGIAAPKARTVGPVSDRAINLNISALDAAIGANVTGTAYLEQGSDVNTNLSALDAGLGVRQENGTFILKANTVNQNLGALDRAVAAAIVRTGKDGVTSADTLDEVLVDLIDAVEWTVIAIDAANPNKKTVAKIIASHDGTVVSDASSTDSNLYGRVELGGTIAGLSFNVDLTDSGIQQKMRLRVQSTSAVNCRAARVKI